jgi:hypothetical protein
MVSKLSGSLRERRGPASNGVVSRENLVKTNPGPMTSRDSRRAQNQAGAVLVAAPLAAPSPSDLGAGGGVTSLGARGGLPAMMSLT